MIARPWLSARGRVLAALFAVSALISLGLLSFAGWLAYLLVMHFTHGGSS